MGWERWRVRAPDEGGFGTRLVARTMTYQLGGMIAYDWAGTGLIVTLRMSRARLAS